MWIHCKTTATRGSMHGDEGSICTTVSTLLSATGFGSNCCTAFKQVPHEDTITQCSAYQNVSRQFTTWNGTRDKCKQFANTQFGAKSCFTAIKTLQITSARGPSLALPEWQHATRLQQLLWHGGPFCQKSSSGVGKQAICNLTTVGTFTSENMIFTQMRV